MPADGAGARPTVAFLFPGDPATRTGGFIYDATICDGLAERGWQVDRVVLPDGWPDATPDRLAAADAALSAIGDGASVVIDGLAGGVLAPVLARHADRLRLLGLVHHPLADETGLDAARQAELQAAERVALAHMRTVMTPSLTTARALVEMYGVPADRVTAVPPGIHPAPLAAGSNPGAGPTLLCVATLTPRKGHLVLLDALGGLTDRAWRLMLAGSGDRAPDHARKVKERVAQRGLGDRVTFLGEVDAEGLAAAYHAADLLVLPSFHEGFGMVIVEAVARGVPVVASRAGAIPEALPDGAGVLVSPGDVAGWQAALGPLLDDPVRLAALADGARRARPGLWTWDQAAEAFAQSLDRVPA